MELWRGYERSFVRLVAHGAGKLVARAATVDGARKPLSWAVDEFFLGISTELERLGVARRVAAGMFGVSRRTYLRKLQAAEIGTQTGVDSLWWGVLQELRAESLTRPALMAKFARHSPEMLGSIVFDLLESGLIEERDGRYVGTNVVDEWSEERLQNFICLFAGRHGLPSSEELAVTLGVAQTRIEEALDGEDLHLTVEDAEHEALWGLLELFVEHGYLIAHRELSGVSTDGLVYRIALTESGTRHLPQLQEIIIEGRKQIRGRLNAFLDEHGKRGESSSGVLFTAVLSHLTHDPDRWLPADRG